MNSFYNDDLLQRGLILWVMAVLIMYGNNASLVDEDITAMRSTVGSYMVARISGSAAHLLYSFASYHHRRQQRLWVALTVISMLFYIPLYFETVSLRGKIAAAAVGGIFEECSWVFCFSPAAKKMLKAKYTTAVDIAHEVDRYAAFYIVVLGEYLYQIVVGSPAAVGFNLSLLHAVWVLIIAFCLNWLYAHNDGALQSTHPFRYSVYTAFAWATLHLPLVASLLASGHVAATSAVEDRFRDPERWLFCGSLGTGLYCLYGLALLYEDRDPPGTLMLSKVGHPGYIDVSFTICIYLPFLVTKASSLDYAAYHWSDHHPSRPHSRPRYHLDPVDYHGPDSILFDLGECHLSALPRRNMGALGKHKVP
jgi:hypothetical protein